MKRTRSVVFVIIQFAAVVLLELPAFAANTAPSVDAGSGQTIALPTIDPKISVNTCSSPASSVSVADPFITTFSITVKPGDAVLSVVDGYRAVGKTISSVVFNGSEALTKSAGTLGNTMGAEIWSLKNPTATTANIVITYTNGGTFVFDRACARTFTGVDLPVQSSAVFTAANSSGGISLTGLTSTSDKAIFVDIAACNCGGLIMTPEANRTLGLNAGPNQVGSSTIVTKSPAGNDTMPWTAGAVQATEAGVVYPPLPSGALANLSGTATDDGLPSGSLQTTWSKFSGPGTVSFANASALNTTATFSTAGTYVLRLTATDTALSSSADVTIVVNPAGGTNTAPAVNAGSGQTITLSAGDPKISVNTCSSPASSVSAADPFITTFSITVKPGDAVLSVVDGYRAVGKTISSVVFNGSEALTKSAGTLGNTMGAEIWSLKNPTATTANIVITYTNGGVFVFDRACARTFTGVDLPVQSSAVFTAANSSGGISLTGLTSTSDKAIFVDIAACNCGGLIMTPETNRTLGLNAGPNQVGSSTIVTKSPAGNDTMPWTAGAVQATEAGVVYPPLANSALANLSGTATDDGLPNGSLLTTWSKFSGPGTVSFSNASALNTTATFTTVGTYVLRLTASDTALSSSADVTIVVNPNSGTNTAPVVSAGTGQTITLPAGANLSGTATDDGLPNGSLVTTWSKFSGPGTVTFSNASALNTTATFSIAGSYVLRLTANDSALSSSADVTIVVNAANTAPAVSAGSNQTITLSAGDPKISVNTCSSPASSVSAADPFITTFSITVKPGDAVLSVVDGYRAVGKTISSVVFNGSEALTKSAGTLGNTMGAEIWSLKNPTATTANIVITYTNGGTFVFDRACARTFTGVDLPVQSSAVFTAANSSGGISLTGLTSTSDKAIFVDIAACNCGGLIMTPETNRTLGLNAGPNQVGSSTIVTKSPAGNDTMPWTAGAVQATEAGVVYPPLANSALANLSGTATDDGLPNGSLLTTWSKFSGPGTVSFSNASALNTTATFTTVGTYVLRLTATDTALSSSADVTIVVNPNSGTNTAPTVSAGSGQTITLPAGANLSGTATDDGLPNGSLVTTWSKFSGPGTVTFSNASALSTTATFSLAGSYILRLTATDSALSSSADVTITVNAANTAPAVSAGSGQTITLPAGANLSGTATDDGLPNGSLVTTWSKFSGPGTVSFSNASALSTTATFSLAGSYILRLTATDSALSSSADVTITVNAANTAPTVNAGSGQTITLPATANLSGTAMDDGLPAGSTLSTTWSKFSGPGTVTFSNASALNPTATFSTSGTYVLRLTASDTVLSSSADVTIIVNPAGNTAPLVSAGTGQTITLPATANLAGTASDDGLPTGSTLSTTWSKFSGPGTVTFSNASALNPTATFSTSGTYVLRLTASDTVLSSSADVTIIVNPAGGNTAPLVSAGTGQTITLPSGANLAGTVTDDGLPSGMVSVAWSKLTGPGTVTFSNASATNNLATFSAAGTYSLRLTANDGALSASADVTIVVNPPLPPQPDNGFSVMSTALAMQGQTNWFFYNSGDAPEGAYFGWLFQAQTLTGNVQLPKQLSPGRYYISFYGITYDTPETIQAFIGGGASTIVTLNDRDANRYWSDRVVVDVTSASNQLQIKLTRAPANPADQRYLFRGMYITDNADETMTFDGYAVKLVYPTIMDDTPAVKGNLVPNGGFETPVDTSWGFVGGGFGTTVPINTMWDSTQGHSGQGSLKVLFDAATRLIPDNPEEEFISRVYHLKPNKKYTVSMWVKTSPGLSTTAKLSLINTYDPPAGYPPQHRLSTNAITVGDVWTRLSLTGYVLQYPTSDYQVHVVTNGPSGSYLLVDDVQLEEGELTNFAPPAAVEAGLFIDMGAKPGNIFYIDELLRTDIVVRNNTTSSQTKTLRYEIYDQVNGIAAQGSVPLNVPPSTTQRLQFDLSTGGKQGIFRAVTWIENDDRTERELVYSIIPRPPTTTADVTSFLGIHGHYFDPHLKMLQRLGIKWNRASSPSPYCRWSIVEPTDNQFVWFDAEVQRANANGVSTMCTIGTNLDWPAWANNGGLPNLAKWQEYVSQLVTHYKPFVKYWEIWNESYKAFTPDFYAQILKLAADAIEAADPTAVIIGLGGSPPASIPPVVAALEARYPTWNWKQHIDVLSTHDYPDGIPPEDLIPTISTYGLPVWNTEAGAVDLGFYQGVNSNFVAWGKNAWPNADASRYYTGMIGASTVVTENFARTIASGQTKYFYYDSRYQASPNVFKQGTSFLEYDGTVRTKAISYAVAGSLIDHSIGLGNASSDPSSFMLVFDKTGGPIASLFTGDKKLRKVTISLSPAQYQVLDLMGNPVTLSGGSIPFGRIPVFLKGVGITAATLKAALQAGSVTMGTDTTPPKLSISDAPRGPIGDHSFRVRWIALDDSSYPNLGEIDPATNSATDSANPNAIVYSYFLNGYSADWSSWSAVNYVDFSNVPSGSYTFSVVAKDQAGNQSTVVNRAVVIN